MSRSRAGTGLVTADPLILIVNYILLFSSFSVSYLKCACIPKLQNQDSRLAANVSAAGGLRDLNISRRFFDPFMGSAPTYKIWMDVIALCSLVSVVLSPYRRVRRERVTGLRQSEIHCRQRQIGHKLEHYPLATSRHHWHCYTYSYTSIERACAAVRRLAFYPLTGRRLGSVQWVDLALDILFVVNMGAIQMRIDRSF